MSEEIQETKQEEVQDVTPDETPVQEEVQDAKPEETPVKEEVKEEKPVAAAAPAPAQETVSIETPKKKVNKLSLDAVNRKIAQMEEKNLQQSKYYKHLNERKQELQGSAQ